MIDKEKYLKTIEESHKSYEDEKFPWTRENLIRELECLIKVINEGYFDINETKYE